VARRPAVIAGVVIFVTGYGINLSSDKTLRELRQRNGEGIYSIPHGGLFKLISSPNYFGEMIEWIGWAILTWSFAGVAFAVFTIANLFPRAIANHKWYRRIFPEYPKERKAIVPFLL
jgi:3-oxo-5-alpha-steroid 4-dehydrogenase 1